MLEFEDNHFCCLNVWNPLGGQTYAPGINPYFFFKTIDVDYPGFTVTENGVFTVLN
jgi:hypothetical protein